MMLKEWPRLIKKKKKPNYLKKNFKMFTYVQILFINGSLGKSPVDRILVCFVGLVF